MTSVIVMLSIAGVVAVAISIRAVVVLRRRAAQRRAALNRLRSDV